MKLKDIGVVVLSHGRRDKLEKSLKSYEENGLIDMVGDNFIFFNEVSSDDISLIENDYKKFEWGGHPVNCGIGWGMIKSITECDAKYVLFLENDFHLEREYEKQKRHTTARNIRLYSRAKKTNRERSRIQIHKTNRISSGYEQ